MSATLSPVHTLMGVRTLLPPAHWIQIFLLRKIRNLLINNSLLVATKRERRVPVYNSCTKSEGGGHRTRSPALQLHVQSSDSSYIAIHTVLCILYRDEACGRGLSTRLVRRWDQFSLSLRREQFCKKNTTAIRAQQQQWQARMYWIRTSTWGFAGAPLLE